MNKITLLSLPILTFLTLSSLSAGVIEIKGEQQFNSEVLQSDKPVVVKVSATWCGACKNAKGPFHELSQELTDIKFVAMDLDANRSVAQKYGAEYLPTFLYFNNGQSAAKKNDGFTSKDQLRNEIVNALGGGKKKPELSVAKDQAQAEQSNVLASQPDTTAVKGSACLASQGYLTNAYNAVRDFFVNIGNTVQSWFK
jgi:thioredoxin 1